MDVGTWLRSLGLGQYEALFRENEIDAEILPELSESDFEKIGIPLGHRKRLIKGIAALSAPSFPPAPWRADEARQRSSSSFKNSAERRHLIVVFCDLAGSTSISAKLDVEEWRDLVNGYLNVATKAVQDMGGHVARKVGDGLMALFGFPFTREDDCERAVRAALAIQRALGELNAGNSLLGKPKLAARIGIASGLVVVDASGEVFGDAPNIAARVQALAEPGSVLATADVQRQIAGLFVAEDCGMHELKGLPKPLALYRLVRQTGAARRLVARTLPPLVGRQAETATLARCWERAKRGEGQLVLVTAEPGLGKSRLIEEFRLILGATAYSWIEWNCSQLLQNTALHPVVEWGRRRFNVDDPVEQRLAGLETTLKLLGLDPGEYVPLLASAVDIPLPPDRMPQGMSPDEIRRRQFAAITQWVFAGARAQPIILICEDLHWADPTTLELLRGLAERGADIPLFILATARPEFRQPWSLCSHHSALILPPLEGEDAKRMIDSIAPRNALSPEIIEGVATRAGGVPLFIEELTRLLLERGENGNVAMIPPTLQQSLAARLDRLGPSREIAQIAAILGRDFSYALLQAVADLEVVALSEALERLQQAGLVIVRGRPPEAEYSFKHILIRDAAYEGLLRSRRKVLNHRAAEVLIDSFSARAEAQPEIVAHHFTEADLAEPASNWWWKAGEQAVRRSAIVEAISHFEKAIAFADSLPDAPERRIGRLQMQIAYSNTLSAARGYTAKETATAYARALKLTAGIENADERWSIRVGLCTGSIVRGEIAPAREMALAFLSDVADRQETGAAGIAHQMLGITSWSSGKFLEAQERLKRALDHYDPVRDSSLAFTFIMDPRVAALMFLALSLWSLGHIDRAVRCADEAVERASELDHVFTLVQALAHRCLLDTVLGNHDFTLANSRILLDLTLKFDLRLLQAYGAFLHEWARWSAGESDARPEHMRKAIGLLRQQGAGLDLPHFETLLSMAQGAAGDVEGALAHLDGVVAEIERSDQRWSEAEAYRVRGELLLKREPVDRPGAEAAFRRGLEIARAQQARSYELRTATSLARLWRDQGRRIEARAVLAPVHDWFSEGFHTRDLKEAKALLDELA